MITAVYFEKNLPIFDINEWPGVSSNPSSPLPLLAMLCLEHFESCTCCPVEDQVLLYRHGLDELSQFVERPQARLRQYWKWKARVDGLLVAGASKATDIKHEEGEKQEATGESKESEKG